MTSDKRALSLFSLSGILLFLFGYTFKSLDNPWGLLFGALLSFCAGLASMQKGK